jgi:GNAT superfamily N-acetyltransferase
MTIEITPVTGMDQLECWVEIHNAIRPDNPSTAAAKALVRAHERERVDLLAYIDGVPVGTAVVTGDVASRETGRPYMQIEVLPAYRGRGVGDALLRAASDHARQFGRTELSCDADADDAYSLGFLQRRGFVEHGRWRELELDLPSFADDRAPAPAGVEIVSVAERPGLLEGMYGVATDVYPTLGGWLAGYAESFVGWQVYTLGGPEVLLDLVLVAVAADDVIGYGTARSYGEASADIRMTVVLPAWRRRGVGRALVGAQAAAARSAGLRRLIAWVPADSGTERVYTTLGFRAISEEVELRGPLR